MRMLIKCVNKTDDHGNPTGGYVKGIGINISWQDGPLGNPIDLRNHNGAFVEAGLEACLQRLLFFQKSKFKHDKNQEAIDHIEAALTALDERTAERKERAVEGTHVA